MEPTRGHPALKAHEQEQSAAPIVAPDEQMLSAIEPIHSDEREQDRGQPRDEAK